MKKLHKAGFLLTALFIFTLAGCKGAKNIVNTTTTNTTAQNTTSAGAEK